MVAAVSSSNMALQQPCVRARVSRDGYRTVVWLYGEHDIATMFDLADTLAKAICADDANLIIDLSGVTFIDVATIHVVRRACDVLAEQSRSVTLRSPSRQAKRVLDLCGFTGLVELGLSAPWPQLRPPAAAIPPSPPRGGPPPEVDGPRSARSGLNSPSTAARSTV
jgi:anti-anti-sigma factor